MVPNIYTFRDDMALVPILFAGDHDVARLATVARNLPGLKRSIVTDGAICVDDIIHNSDLAHRSPEGRRMVVKAWRVVLDGLRRDDDLHIGFTALIRDRLEQYWHEDRGHSLFTASSPWPRTKLLFECLAEISYNCSSTTIGNVLSSFWQKYGDRITTEDPCLDEWALAILRSSMSKSQKIICLQQVVRIIPELSGRPWFEADGSFASDVKRFIMRLRDISRSSRRHDYSVSKCLRLPYSRAVSCTAPSRIPLIEEYGSALGPLFLSSSDGFDSDSDYILHPRFPGPTGPSDISRMLDTVVRAHDLELEEKERRMDNMEYNLDMLNAKVDSLSGPAEFYNYLR